MGGDSRPVRADVDELWREVLTQQFHDILPGSSIAWVHADAEAVFARVAEDLEARIGGLLAEIAPQGRSLANPADVPVDGVVVLEARRRHRRRPTLTDGSLAVAVTVPALGVAPFEAQPIDDRVVVYRPLDDQRRASPSAGTSPATSVRSSTSRGPASCCPTGTLGAVLELAADHPVEYDAWDLEAWTRADAAALTDVPTSRSRSPITGPLVGRRRRAADVRAVVELTHHLRTGGGQRGARRPRRPRLARTTNICCRWPSRSTCGPTWRRCDVQFGTVAPPDPSRPTRGTPPSSRCAPTGSSTSAEPAFGVAILNDGRYGHCVFDGAVRVSLARAAKYPDPSADHGRHRVTHGGAAARWRSGARACAEARAELARAGDRIGDGPVRRAGHRCTTPPGRQRSRTFVRGLGGGAVDAVKQADDGSGDLVVRLHEACGDRTALAVRADRRVVAAWQCNLLEEPTRASRSATAIVAMTLRPFEIVTLRLTARRDLRRPGAVTAGAGRPSPITPDALIPRLRQDFRAPCLRNPDASVRSGAGAAARGGVQGDAGDSSPARRTTHGSSGSARPSIGSRSAGVPPRNIIAPGTCCST